jgi:6-phosphogluconolactonase
VKEPRLKNTFRLSREGNHIPNLTVHSDINDLYKQVLTLFERHALESVKARGRFCVALAGGSTPKAIYERLAKLNLPWDDIHLFWGDERCELGGQAGAAAYKAELEVMFDGPIVLDLVHLGLGPDGHTASLFPSTPDWDSPEPVRVTFPGPTLEPQVERISLGFAVLNAARAAHFFVTGANKAEIVSELWGGVYPADQVHTPDTLWLLDKDAARFILEP